MGVLKLTPTHTYSLSHSARPCLAEMTSVMTCWKANSFNDVPCKKEVEEFVKCSERVVSWMGRGVGMGGGAENEQYGVQLAMKGHARESQSNGMTFHDAFLVLHPYNDPHLQKCAPFRIDPKHLPKTWPIKQTTCHWLQPLSVFCIVALSKWLFHLKAFQDSGIWGQIWVWLCWVAFGDIPRNPKGPLATP